MSEEMACYRRLELCLWIARWKYDGDESAEEDGILDEMEAVWASLSGDEQTLLRLEGPRCWPTDSSAWPPELPATMFASTSTSWRYEGFQSPADAIQSPEAA